MSSAQIRGFCCKEKYKYHDRLTKDVVNTVSKYQGLTAKLDSYIYENGNEETLIALDGTIPIRYRNNQYHIPICIYLRKDHPETEPIVYVRPTSQMTIKESKNVDSQGKVSVLYLTNWKNTNELLLLIQVLIITFSETPPVYKKPESSSQTAAQVRPAYPSTANPYPNNNQYPFSNPGFSSAGYYPTSSYGSGNNSYSQSNSNTISEAHIRASLLSAAGDKLKERLREKLDTYNAEIDVLKKTGDDLQSGTRQLDQIIHKMETDIGLLENTKAKLDEKDKKLDELIIKYESAEKDFNVDDVYGPNEPIYKQLLNTFAEENSIADAIFHLNDALKKEVIDLEVFLKHVRELSRRQFMLRALMQKCREKAGLSY